MVVLLLFVLALTGVEGLGKRLKRSGDSLRTTMALELAVRPARPLVVVEFAAMMVYFAVVYRCGGGVVMVRRDDGRKKKKK